MPNLSLPTLQYLKTTLEGAITILSDDIADIARLEGDIWNQCDPELAESADAFRKLNAIRTVKRNAKKQLNRLTSVQLEIKRTIAGAGSYVKTYSD